MVARFGLSPSSHQVSLWNSMTRSKTTWQHCRPKSRHSSRKRATSLRSTPTLSCVCTSSQWVSWTDPVRVQERWRGQNLATRWWQANHAEKFILGYNRSQDLFKSTYINDAIHKHVMLWWMAMIWVDQRLTSKVDKEWWLHFITSWRHMASGTFRVHPDYMAKHAPSAHHSLYNGSSTRNTTTYLEPAWLTSVSMRDKRTRLQADPEKITLTSSCCVHAFVRWSFNIDCKVQ